MGLYIEPTDKSKQQWCDENGMLITESRSHSNIDYSLVDTDKIIVCLVDNGYFQAGAVAFNEREFNCFNSPDGRTKRWYEISKNKVKKVCPMWNQYMERT